MPKTAPSSAWPGTRQGPTAPPDHPVPLQVGEPPRHQATARRGRSRGVQHVVARGEVGGGWALVGARRGTTPKLSGRELPSSLAPTDKWAILRSVNAYGAAPLPWLPTLFASQSHSPTKSCRRGGVVTTAGS